jgi:imidazoleglycerol-phosphate dehydratase / histidinol-phosphatase
MKKFLFIDRDGTLINEPPDEQIDSFEKLAFLPGVFTWLGRIARELDYELVMVTNQDGLGTNSFPEKTFWPVQDFIMNSLQNEGIYFKEVLIDRSFPYENKDTRKPGTGLLREHLQYDLSSSYVIGDRDSDIELAKNLGCKSIRISSWENVYATLTERKARHQRNTNETKISVELNLDGQGNASIKTGLGFFDHMLEQLAKHSGMDLVVDTQGDLHIDEHHTIEDTAITLGEAVAIALGNKAGIERYGFCLPMDEALAQVALDFGGRPALVWETEFKREKIGDMPTEMFSHFFKSFCDGARCNINIKAEGSNEHHKIEAIFKALARSIKMAITKNGNNLLPTTKGVL